MMIFFFWGGGILRNISTDIPQIREKLFLIIFYLFILMIKNFSWHFEKNIRTARQFYYYFF